MDDLIPALLDALFWLFIIDFDRKGEAWFKIILWLIVIAVVAGGIAFVLAV